MVTLGFFFSFDSPNGLITQYTVFSLEPHAELSHMCHNAFGSTFVLENLRWSKQSVSPMA